MFEDIKASDNEATAITDSPVLKTKSLAKIYQRCSIVIVELTSYSEAAKVDAWNEVMKE